MVRVCEARRDKNVERIKDAVERVIGAGAGVSVIVRYVAIYDLHYKMLFMSDLNEIQDALKPFGLEIKHVKTFGNKICYVVMCNEPEDQDKKMEVPA